MKWRGYCDGYPESSETTLKPARSSAGKLIHTKKAPLVVDEPLVNTIRFESSDQRAYFDEWCSLSVNFLSGGLARTRLWTATMPQLSLEEPTLRYGAMAVGALRMAYTRESGQTGTVMTTTNKHYLNAITYYCEALRLQSRAQPDREGLRTAMLSSLLFICFETQRANMPAALKHITHGFSMLNELATCAEKAPDLVSIAPAPPSLVQEILDCYKPLELQSRSFMGAYQKFFFPSSQRPPGQAPPSTPQRVGTYDASAATKPGFGRSGVGYGAVQIHGLGYQQVPQFQTTSPFRSPQSPEAESPPRPPPMPTYPPQAASPTGLPSPQSQGSPQQQGERQGPPNPQRPRGILPFSKHSPYFRPKQTSITSLEELPPVFATFDEAQGYWGLLQRQMVHSIPVLTRLTSQLELPKVQDDEELEAKLNSVKRNPQISKFVAESRYWLQRWIEAFNPLFQSTVTSRAQDPQAYLEAANLRIEYLILYIYTAIPRFSGLVTAKGLTPQYREINYLARELLQARPHCGFAMDSGWTWPLFVTTFGCRDPATRDEAIGILEQYPIRNALRDSRIFRAIALRNREVELDNAQWGDDEQAQWLRLRRRELVFEDFGTNIIYRSAQRDPETGKWGLVEEAADFTVKEDGTLDWHRQPISEASSILSGVC